MRDLLYFVYWFPPLAGVGVQRSVPTVKYLPSFGYRPLVVTTGSGWYAMKDDGTWAADVPDDVPVARPRELPVWWLRQKSQANPRFRPPRIFGWGASFSGWIPGAVRAGLHFARTRRPAAIYSSGPPFSAHVAAWVVHRRTGIPWVVEFQDEWARHPWIELRDPIRRLTAWLEDRVCREADALISVSPNIRVGSDEPVGERREVNLIPNGVDLADFQESPQPIENGRLVISHVGSIIGPRCDVAERFVGAVEQAIDRGIPGDEIELRLVGGVSRPVSSHRFRISQSGYATHRDAIGEMRSATALLLVTNAGDVYGMTVPAKTYEYVASGRPVLGLAVGDGPAAQLISSTGTGWVTEPDDVEGMTRLVTDLHGRWRRGELREPTSVPPATLRPHTREYLTGEIAGVVDRVVEGKGPERE